MNGLTKVVAYMYIFKFFLKSYGIVGFTVTLLFPTAIFMLRTICISYSHKLLCLFIDAQYCVQAMESNKADWDTLFESYPFFEAYKNYLQIDINAENADDLRNWKGWVESRLRQLTLKVRLLCICVILTLFISLSYAW